MATTRRRRLLWAFDGRVPYLEALARQREARAALRAGTGAERLFLLEHPHVYTLGRNARGADVLAGGAWLRARGVEVVDCDRGGQVTYHGPGQLVGYPVLDLNPDRRDIRRYVRDLQEVLIRTLAAFGVAAERRPGPENVGIWVGERKIASLGVHLSRWITTHGFALNVATDLTYFRLITPCGLHDRGVTTMEYLLGRAPAVADVKAALVRRSREVFGSGGAAGSPLA